MATKQSVMQGPPFASDPVIEATKPFGGFMTTIQNISPLLEVDTSSGSYGESVPKASENLNQTRTYIKVSGDGNTFTLNGVAGGPYTLTTQYDKIIVKSNGAVWYKVN